MKQIIARKICVLLAEKYPEVETELTYGNHFQLLVAVILSAQATDKSVNLVTEPLFKQIKNPQQMVDFGYEPLANAIRSIGLWRNKAKNVISMSEDLISNFGSEVPSQREQLLTLAGVGRKTANVILNVAFGQPTIAVDTHIFRVSNRLGLAVGKTPDAVEKVLEKVVPQEYRKDIHLWLIMWGRSICRARKPQCEQCQLRPFCRYGQKIAKKR